MQGKNQKNRPLDTPVYHIQGLFSLRRPIRRREIGLRRSYSFFIGGLFIQKSGFVHEDKKLQAGFGFAHVDPGEIFTQANADCGSNFPSFFKPFAKGFSIKF